MSPIASILVYFVRPIIGLFIIAIFVNVIMSWLISFNIINLRNQFAAQIYQISEALTRPILDPIRRVIPSIGGLDLSPIIALLFLSWLNNYVIFYLVQALC